jgi:dTDP-glucose 4,6-dehydratase
MNSRQIDLIEKDCTEVFGDALDLVKLKGETILITGGTGFVGSWIIESINYLNKKYDFNTTLYVLGKHTKEHQEKYPHLYRSENIKTIQQDVRQLAELPSEISWIIHAAATPDNRVHASKPLDVIDTIVNGTSRLLEVASLLPNLNKIVNLSSGLIYGRHSVSSELISEDTVCNLNCASMSSSYAEAKRMCETLTNVYRSQFRIPIVTLRPFAFIGPYQHLDRPWAINNFLRDAINGSQIKILGNENTVRSYMYPADMAYWILSSLANGKDGLTINLGSAEGTTLRSLSEVVASNFVNKPSISSNLNNTSEVAGSFVPSVEKAKRELNLSATIKLEDAIKRTINWFQIVD